MGFGEYMCECLMGTYVWSGRVYFGYVMFFFFFLGVFVVIMRLYACVESIWVPVYV